jgi:2-methylcitrate dehydratase PrpD
MMTDLTKIFSNFVSQATLQNFNDEMIFFSKMSMIDWCGVAYAAKEEPVSKIVTKLIEEEQTKGQSKLISNGQEVSAKSAAFVNGTIGHALDYDDTHFLFTGHPTASAFPTALALGEELGSSIDEIMLAYMCGVEISTRLGHILGYSHYNKGFHQTATSGAFGATLVASKLLKLNAQQIENALGIVSTRASGLKSQFGTMGKPFHAGIAASNGIEAAKLSKLGFVSCENGIECNQGFLKTHAWDGTIPEAAINGLGKDFLFPEIKYKFHACCHGLHAFLEALDELKTKNNFNPDSIEKISIQTQPSWLQVCNIDSPKTGLEAKFSYRLTAAMSLHGVDTGRLDSYNDEICFDEKIVKTRDKVEVIPNDQMTNTEALIELKDGSEIYKNSHDLNNKIENELLEKKILTKSSSLLSDKLSNEIFNVLNSPEKYQAKDITNLLK